MSMRNDYIAVGSWYAGCRLQLHRLCHLQRQDDKRPKGDAGRLKMVKVDNAAVCITQESPTSCVKRNKTSHFAKYFLLWTVGKRRCVTESKSRFIRCVRITECEISTKDVFKIKQRYRDNVLMTEANIGSLQCTPFRFTSCQS